MPTMLRRLPLWLPREAPEGLSVARDEHGVPHVHALDRAGLLWGLGYCHARDRGLQMLLMRIAGQGRLSECLVASDETLRADQFFRRHAFHRGASQHANELDPDDQLAVEAYVAGVNARLRRHRPVELRLARYRPEPWTVADTILMSRLIGYVGLAQTQAELEGFLVEMIQAGVPDRHLQAMFPGIPELEALGRDEPGLASRELIGRVRLGERVVPAALEWLRLVPAAIASNNWAIAPRRSRSGHALLANDPHLEINRLPNVWYEMVGRIGELDEHYVIASTMPGLPVPVIGRTRDVAWGVTYAYLDGVDSWIEDCRDGRYRRGDEMLPFEERKEEIRRKGKPSVVVTFHENDHGVLDGDPRPDGLRLATRWASRDSGSRSLSAMLPMWTSRSVRQAMNDLGRVELAFNWVMADRKGNVGYQMSGLAPRRRTGVSGLLPLPGWDPRNDWQGFLSPEELPRSENPVEGFIVTANDDLNHLGRAAPQNATMASYRARRIAEVIEEKGKLGVSDCQALQYDTVSLQARAFLEVLRPLLPDDEPGRLLRDWDCRYERSSLAAALFERFYRALVRRVLGERLLGASVLEHLLDETPLLVSFFGHVDRVLLDPPQELVGGEDRDALYRKAFEEACGEGPLDPPAGARVQLNNLFFGAKLPAWTGFSRGPVSLEGGRACPNQMQLFRAAGRDTCLAASVRLVADLGEDALYSVLVGGPSDRRWSRWYASEVESWLEGRYKRLTAAPPGVVGTTRPSLASHSRARASARVLATLEHSWHAVQTWRAPTLKR